ncbi:MAG: BatD family protein [Polyangiaceae bacterium]
MSRALGGVGRAAGAAVICAVISTSQAAHAAPAVQTAVSTQHIGVGEPLVVQITVTSETDVQFTDARLPLAPGMTVGQPSLSRSSQVSYSNGQVSQQYRFTLTWNVVASKTGTFRIGPPSVLVSGERAQGSPIQIQVVAGSTGASRPLPQRGFDPFGMFGGNSPFPPGFSPFGDDTDDQQPQQEPSYPVELRLDKAPDPNAFVRATLTPDQVYVGQQVMLRVSTYGAHGPYNLTNLTEPSHAEFLAFDVSADQPQFYAVPIGGVRYYAEKIRELPLFPLHAGKLRAGRTKAEFVARGYMRDPNTGTERESNWAEVTVIEPPLAGRPAGYKIGDVGDYKLTATVEPRDIMAGEAVSVVATLSGVGLVPFKILTPEHPGVEWLEPSLTEKVEATHGQVGGTRTFSYVVKVSDPGKLDLGEVTLPYFDAKKRDYVIARAALGSLNVKVNPNAKRADAQQKPDDRLANVLTPRDALGAFPSASRPLADRTGFWAALLLAPFGMVFAGGAVSAATRARTKLRERGASLAAQLESALREARELAKSDVAGSVSATERAVFLAIEAKLGLKARAILKTELASSLTARGLPGARAQALAKLLEDCDAVRFVGAASGLDPAELAQRAAKNATEMRGEKLAAAS